MEILFLFVLIIINGLFAMSEIALVTAKRSRLSKLAEDGDKSAAVAVKLGHDLTSFLSTIQIGITSIGILNGIVGEGALAGPLALRLQTFGMDAEPSHILATVVVVLSITYVTIVIGELVPKRLGQLNPERIACLVSRPMFTISTITHPFARLLSAPTAASTTPSQAPPTFWESPPSPSHRPGRFWQPPAHSSWPCAGAVAILEFSRGGAQCRWGPAGGAPCTRMQSAAVLPERVSRRHCFLTRKRELEPQMDADRHGYSNRRTHPKDEASDMWNSFMIRVHQRLSVVLFFSLG